MKDEEVARLRKQVRAFSRRLQRELPGIYGLTQTTGQMLGHIGRDPEGVQPGQIASEMEMTNSNVAAALRSLEAGRLVVRTDDPFDGRKARIKLTKSGVDLLARVRGNHYAWLRRTMEAVLTPDERALLIRAGDIMQRLAEHVPEPEVYAPPPSPRPSKARKPTKSEA